MKGAFHRTVRIGPAVTLLGVVLVGMQATVALCEPGDLVILRQVEPRVAYRGLPLDEYPINSQVSTFPWQPFDAAMGAVNSVTDAELTGHGSMGLAGNAIVGALEPLLGGNALALGGAGGNGLTPGGAIGGGFAGPMTGATASLGNTISNAVGQALQPLSSMPIPGVAK